MLTSPQNDRFAVTRTYGLLFAIGFTVLCFTISGLVTASSFRVQLTRRVSDLATLRTLGAQPRQLRHLITTQGVLLGGAGGLGGILLGHTLTQLTYLFLEDYFGFPHVFSPAPTSWLALAAPITTAVAAALVGICPVTRSASHLSPVATSLPQRQRHHPAYKLALGIFLLLAGAALLAYVFLYANPADTQL